VRRVALSLVVGVALGCSTPERAPVAAKGAPIAASSPVVAAASATGVISAAIDAGAAPRIGATASDRITAMQAEEVLFLQVADEDPGVVACRGYSEEGERIRCLITARYAGDAEAARDALALYARVGSVAGVLPAEAMDGGFRGRIQLVPQAPMGTERRHLAWITAANEDFDTFFTELARDAKSPLRYRFRDLTYRFFRSVKRTTPSAYADRWSVAYNVAGSLNTSADAVRETLFHEIFHLDDAAHDDWSARVLRSTFDAIVLRCGTRAPCLAPYAPNDTMVRGGTYYAFQPNNGDAVHEYAAELALRYYRENRASIRGETLTKPGFKCGPPENQRAWEALASEFFGGVDRTPTCSTR
jgi:hypothetical protein